MGILLPLLVLVLQNKRYIFSFLEPGLYFMRGIVRDDEIFLKIISNGIEPFFN